MEGSDSDITISDGEFEKRCDEKGGVSDANERLRGVTNQKKVKWLLDPEKYGIPVYEQSQMTPEGGTKYVFEWNDGIFDEDWISDGYRWRNYSSKSFVYEATVKGCKQRYYKYQLAAGDNYTLEFTRQILSCPLMPNRVLVIYIGNHKLHIPSQHGNAKKTKRNYSRKLPSIAKKSRMECQNLPSQVHQNRLLEAPQELERHVVEVPDYHQTKYAVTKGRVQDLISHDEYYNLAEIGVETNFVKILQIAPCAITICYRHQTMNDFRKLLRTPNLPTQCLSYDTTYDMGNCYLSVLCYRQTELEECPVMPLMYMLHTQRHASVHNHFFMELVSAIPELPVAEKVVIVTDEEIAIVNAIKRFLPNLPKFRCWLHALRNIKMKLRDLGLSKEEQIAHKKDFFSLLEQPSEDHFHRALAGKYLRWNKIFANYFGKNIKKSMGSLGTWNLRSFGFHLLTTNQSESLNAALKRRVGPGKHKLDTLVLKLFEIDQAYEIQITQSRYGLGEFHLLAFLKDSYSLQPGMKIEKPRKADDIVNEIKAKNKNVAIALPEEQSQDSQPTSLPLPITASVYDRAVKIIEKKDIELIPSQRAWIVKGSSSTKFLVRLFKNGRQCLNCSCPAPTACTHIIAAAESIGYKIVTRKKGNGTTLLRNAMKPAHLQGGKKKPKRFEKYPGKLTDSQADGSSLPFVQNSMLVEEQQMEENERENTDPTLDFSVTLRGDSILRQKKTENNDCVVIKPLKQYHSTPLTTHAAKKLNIDSSNVVLLTPSPVKVVKDHHSVDGPTPILMRANVCLSSAQSSSSKIILANFRPPLKGLVSENMTIENHVPPVDLVTLQDDHLLTAPLPNAREHRPDEAEVAKRVTKPVDPRENMPIDIAYLRSLGSTQWLSDLYIEAALVLLRKLNPQIGGLFNLYINGYSGKFPQAEGSRWIQILHNGEGHWLVASHGFFPPSPSKKSTRNKAMSPEPVTIFDSLYDEVNQRTLASVASLLKTNDLSFRYIISPSCNQENSWDCGIYAVANATSLILDKNPSVIHYDRSKMREHFVACLQNGDLTMFPTVSNQSFPKSKTIKNVQSVKVYCLCRRPDRLYAGSKFRDEEKMIQCGTKNCKEWYHKECLPKEQHYAFQESLKTPWKCPKCL